FSPEIPRLEQVMDTLRDMGFLIYDIVDLVHRQTDGALRKIDLVFLRKENPLLHSNEILSPAEYEGYNSKFAHWNELRAKGKMK
ncbi:MAG: hypothetical protein KGI70_02915, partial [Patescibacteria group bacterium]|nr:hypothetical protein [Patescibacteria group bacterium]